jgi:hydrogenase maturation protease
MVIGVGNGFRRDDAVGLEVARRLRARAPSGEIAVREHEGETLELLDTWGAAEAIVVVDALCSGGVPGTVQRVDASRDPLPGCFRGSSSTHAVGLAEAIELARALHRLPARVVVFGVEGRRFDAGGELTDDVRAVVGPVAGRVLREARALTA